MSILKTTKRISFGFIAAAMLATASGCASVGATLSDKFANTFSNLGGLKYVVDDSVTNKKKWFTGYRTQKNGNVTIDGRSPVGDCLVSATRTKENLVYIIVPQYKNQEDKLAISAMKYSLGNKVESTDVVNKVILMASLQTGEVYSQHAEVVKKIGGKPELVEIVSSALDDRETKQNLKALANDISNPEFLKSLSVQNAAPVAGAPVATVAWSPVNESLDPKTYTKFVRNKAGYIEATGKTSNNGLTFYYTAQDSASGMTIKIAPRSSAEKATKKNPHAGKVFMDDARIGVKITGSAGYVEEIVARIEKGCVVRAYAQVKNSLVYKNNLPNLIPNSETACQAEALSKHIQANVAPEKPAKKAGKAAAPALKK